MSEERQRYPVAAMTAVVLGSLLVLTDTTIIVLALPNIAESFGGAGGVEWVVTAFLMAGGISQVTAGWLSDRLGRRSVFLWATAGFAVCAFVAAASPDLPVMIGARTIQGLCSGLIAPLATALAFSMFPEGKRGTAVGISGTAVMMGPLIAPVLSGLLLGMVSWRLLILIDLPIAAAVILLGRRHLPADGAPIRRPFDWSGLALVSAGLVALLFAFAEAEAWPSGVAASVATIGLALLALFVRHATRSPHPLIDMTIFRVPTFAVALILVALVAVSQFARTVFVPLELRSLRGLSPFETGLALIPAALAAAVAMPLAGRWTDLAGGRRPVTLGLVLVVASGVGFGSLDLDTPLWIVIALMVLSNVGIVVCSMTLTVTGLDAVASHLVPLAAALRSLTRQISGALGTAVLATIITAQAGELSSASGESESLEDAQQAFNTGFLVAAAVAAIGLLLVRRLPRRAPPPARTIVAVEGGEISML